MGKEVQDRFHLSAIDLPINVNLLLRVSLSGGETVAGNHAITAR